jgi:hypothetical protein
MNNLFLRAIFVAIIGLCLLSTQASATGATPVYQTYAGTGMDTSPGSNVSLSQANGKGTFGNFAIAITADFNGGSSGNCAEGLTEFGLLSSEHVETFTDQSQLFGIASDGYGDGYLCADLTEESSTYGSYYGQVVGIYVGGTGRFENAGGTFTSQFYGQNLGAIGFRSIAGTTEGMVEWPK